MKNKEMGFDMKNTQKVIEMVASKLNANNPATIKLKNGKELLVNRNADGYTLYEGCELIVGDVSINYVSLAIIEKSLEAPILMKEYHKEIKIWKVEEIKELLENSPKAVIKGLIAIYNYQEEDEKRSDETKYSNGVGFSGCDARVLGNMAKYAIAKGGLTEKQFAYVKKKICKYAGQLTRIANKKQ